MEFESVPLKDTQIKVNINVTQGIARKVAKEESTSESEKTKYFECSTCGLKEKYDYFGKDPPFVKCYKFREDVYMIEDPFLPPKQGEYIILGAHCIQCDKSVCRASECSFYYDGTYCISCAKLACKNFPQPVRDKLNKVVIK